jgi:hypothetical protein
MISRILKKGMDHIHITDKHSSTCTVFAENFTIFDNTADNSITLSMDLTPTYKGSKQAHTYLDIEKLDSDWSVVSLVEINNNQVFKELIAYLEYRSEKPEKFYINLTAKNQTTSQITFENGNGLRMRVID